MLWKRHLSVYQENGVSLAQIYGNPQAYTQKKPKRTSIVHGSKKKQTLQKIEIQTAQIQKNKNNKKIKTIYIAKGNNHTLIRNQFIQQGFTDTISKQEASIIWVQWSQQIQRIPSSCKWINVIQNHQSITNKQKLYKNIKKYNDGIGRNGKYIPDSYIIDFKADVKSNIIQFFQRYFSPKHSQLKLKKLKQKNGEFKIINTYGQLLIPFKKIEVQQQNKYSQLNEPLWILKPTSLNRGRGIHLFSNLKQLKQLLSQDNYAISVKMYNQSHSPSAYIIQQYLQRPLLIQGFKFDIRIWMLAYYDKKNRKIIAYMYEEGYVRIAGVQYKCRNATQMKQQQNQELKQLQKQRESPILNKIKILNKLGKLSQQKTNKNLDNKYMHLTNNAVQKTGAKYGSKFEGNLMQMQDMQNYFQGKISLKTLMLEIEQMIIDSINSVKGKLGNLQQKGRVQQFQLFGYDFLIDQNFKPWLIETNSNPCLQESSTFLSKLLKQMLSDMIQILRIGQPNQRTEHIIQKQQFPFHKSVNENRKQAKQIITANKQLGYCSSQIKIQSNQNDKGSLKQDMPIPPNISKQLKQNKKNRWKRIA